ncbi:MAG: hypothetical protein E7158_04710 [Firmicutes bacterium]|nr:hypothetical protein [Bacillota bacterium]
MEEKNKAIFGCIVFLILILTIGIGGYYYTFKSDKHKTSDEHEMEVISENKKNQDKDFVYFDNERVISKTLGITYKDAVINLNNTQAEAITNEIKEENGKLYNDVKKISETENDTGNEILYNTDDIYSATIREYQYYNYENYMSLVISDSMYDCFNGIYDYTNVKSYMFDTKNNERVSNVDILNKKDKTLTEVKEKIRKKLEKDKINDENIMVDETIDNLNNADSYGLYIDDDGNLFIKYVVKSDNLNYNDSILID